MSDSRVSTGEVKLKRRKTTVEKAASASADTTRRILCGGTAGMIAKSTFAPLDRIRILAQTGEHGLAPGQNHSIQNVYRTIIKNEGMKGLWAGNGANILRVFPSKGVVFTSNDFWRGQLRWISGTNTHPDEPLSGAMSFIAGGLSGMTATATTYPLDFVRGRISGKIASPNPSSHHYNGILNTMKLTIQEEGIRAIYKGITPALLGSVPYEGIKFGTVGFLEKTFPKQSDDDYNPILRKVCFGGLGGVMAGLVMYPNDTIRRIMQLQGSRGTTVVYNGYFDCVRKTYREYGVGRFYHGIGINLIRMAPNTALQFGCYEMLKNLTADWTF